VFFLQAIVLGIIQGLTEFLPISSSGHLVIFQDQLGLKESQLTLDILLHMGTLAAVIICYRQDIKQLLKALFSLLAPGAVKVEARWRRLLGLIVISTVPTSILGLIIGSKMEWVYASPLFAASMLLITGTFLKLTDIKKIPQRAHKNVEKISILDSLLVGTAQGISVLPGISRSGSTISAGLFLGFSREEAVRYSFLVAIPATAAAQIWSMRDNLAVTPGEWPAYAVGTAVAFLVGYAALKKLISITVSGKLHLFSYYCWGVGALVLALLLF
jgi:undecaprenyl-diphosphatase